MKEANEGKTSDFHGIHPAPMIESILDMHRQLLEYAVELNQACMTRAQAESTLAMDLAAKLAAARSVPDAASAWHNCMKRQWQLNGEDARRLMEQNRRIMQVGAEIVATGGTS